MQLNRTTFIILVTAIMLMVLAMLMVPASKVNYRTSTTKSEIKHLDRSELIQFKDQTLTANLYAEHFQGDKYLTSIDETLGSGSCAFDYDNDGWVDILTIGGTGETRHYGKTHWWQSSHGNHLYRNRGNNQFEDTTQDAGLTAEHWGMGCYSADLDNDGDQDLFLTNLGQNTLYRNNGDGTFTDVSIEAGIKGDFWSTSVAIADYDKDGLLDIYVVNFITLRKGERAYETTTGFKGLTNSSFTPTLYDSQENQLFHNNGGMNFDDRTMQAGVSNRNGRGYSAQWFDINEDSYPDLLVSNDSTTANTLFINQHDGTFSELTSQYRLNTAQRTFGIALGDLKNDGSEDIAIGTDQTNPLIVYQRITGNDGKPVYVDKGRDIGFDDFHQAGFASIAMGLFDANNDGWLDIITGGGFFTPDPDAGRRSQGQRKELWLNQGNGHFKPCGMKCGPAFGDIESNRSFSFADFDNDGDVDLYATHNNSLGQLLINESDTRNWLQISLIGKGSNSDAIGAKVTLNTNQNSFFRVQHGGYGFLSSSDKRLYFGLGGEDKVKIMTVQWPNGEVQQFNNIKAGRHITITQGNDRIGEFDHSPISSKKEFTLFKNENHRLKVAQWLMHNEASRSKNKLTNLLLYEAISSNDKTIRKEAIQSVISNKSPDRLGILTQALEDPVKGNQLLSIQGMQAYEAESSSRWLLRLLNSRFPDIFCQTAAAYEYFFKEEEAMILNKPLAIAELINALEDNNSEVQICAARALGEAENFRAAAPLKALSQREDIAVKSESINSMGHIRDTSFISGLAATVTDEDQPVAAKYQAIIALKRLQYRDIDHLLPALFNDKKRNDAYYMRSLQVMKLLIDNKAQQFVIKPDQVAATVVNWLDKLNKQHYKLNDDLLIKALEILAITRYQEAASLVKSYLGSPNPTVRAHAYEALILTIPDEAGLYVNQGIADANLEVQSLSYHAAKERRIKIPLKRLSELSDRGLNHELIDLIALHNNKQSRDLLLSLLNKANDNELLTYLVDTLTLMGIEKYPLPDWIYRINDEKLLTASIDYWMIRHSDNTIVKNTPPFLPNLLDHPLPDIQKKAIQALCGRREKWAFNLIENRLFDNRISSEKRQLLIEGLSVSKLKNNRSLIYKLVNTAFDPARNFALRYIDESLSTHQIEELMGQINNLKLDEQQRFIAAETLFYKSPKILFEFLNGVES